MAGGRVSEYLIILISLSLAAAHLAMAAGLLVFGWRTESAYPLARWSVWEFAALAIISGAVVVGFSLQRWRRPDGDVNRILLLVAFPALTALALGAAFWATRFLGAPFAPNPDSYGRFGSVTVAIAVVATILAVRYRRASFLSVWFAGLAALVVLNPVIWALLPRTEWWDARILVLPLGAVIILYFSRGWPFALPSGLELKLLVVVIGAAWALSPLIRMYRDGQAPSPAGPWLVVMGLLNWVLVTLLVALPLYGWEFGREWAEDGEQERYPWPAIALLSFAAAFLTAGYLPNLLPEAGIELDWLSGDVVAPAVIWSAPLTWASLLLRAAHWLLLPYAAVLALEELSIWTYQRRVARMASDDEAAPHS